MYWATIGTGPQLGRFCAGQCRYGAGFEHGYCPRAITASLRDRIVGGGQPLQSLQHRGWSRGRLLLLLSYPGHTR